MTNAELNIEMVDSLLEDLIKGRLDKYQVIELIELLYS